MRQRDAKRDVGPTSRHIAKTRARADDYLAAFECRDGRHVLERDMPSQELAGRRTAPDPDEMLVRVRACCLNHVDAALSSGAISQLFAHGVPYICGLDAAGTVIAIGDRVTRFAVGDEVFGHFPAESWAWVEPPCGRTTADGPHVEFRPEGLDPLGAAALAHSGLTAKTILRAAELRPGQTALVIGATCPTAAILLSLLAEAGAHVVATDTTADPAVEALTSHSEVDLLVDLVSFGEPYFITAGARDGTIVTAVPRAYEPGIPRIGISAEPGDLAALAQRALVVRQPVAIGRVDRLETSATHCWPTATPPAQPALALDG